MLSVRGGNLGVPRLKGDKGASRPLAKYTIAYVLKPAVGGRLKHSYSRVVGFHRGRPWGSTTAGLVTHSIGNTQQR